jgi:hypothetical protein
MEDVQRFTVTPLEIIGNEQNRLLRREEHPSDGIEQPVPLLGLREWFRARKPGPIREKLGEQASQLGEIHPVEPGDPLAQWLRAEPRHHRPVGQRSLRRV